MKINIKSGLRRLVIVLITLFSFLIFAIYISNGCIWDISKLENNCFVSNNKDYKIKLPINDFKDSYIDIEEDDFFRTYTHCYPYKQYCILETKAKVYKINNPRLYEYIDWTKTKLLNKKTYVFDWGKLLKNKTIYFEMPSRFQYFTWQLLDFLLIPLFSIIAYLIYLIIEKTFIWILKGFKND